MRKIVSAAAIIINTFKDRVLADSGTFEAESCLNTTVQDLVNKGLYDSASLIVTPNAVKSGKIYSLKGTDLTFTRASVANRTNSVGVIESVATGVPRIEHPVGDGCPSILLEPQRTNLFLNSFAPVTQTITVVNGSIYTVSIKGGTATLSGAGTGSATTGSNRTFTASSTSLTVTITGSPEWCQVELGSFATSIITTTGAAVTRIADALDSPNLQTTLALGATSGTLVLTLLNNIAKGSSCDTAQYGLKLSGGTNKVYISPFSSSRVRIWNNATGIIYQTTTNSVKIALSWNGGNILDIWENGVKVVTGYTTGCNLTNTNYFGTNGGFGSASLQSDFSVQNIQMYSTKLSDSQLAALTT